MAKLRQWICACAVLAGLLFLFVFYHRNRFSEIQNVHERSILKHRTAEALHVLYDNNNVRNVLTFSPTEFIAARNNLSRLLNAKQQELGRLQCEIAAREAINEDHTSNTGGWCIQEVKDAQEHEQGGLHKTDKQLAIALASFFKGKYVGSFGDGPGRYKQLLTDTGLLKGYDAYDGAPFTEKLSEGRVSFLDLTIPQYGLPVYDWIISLEVAEHIPKQYESIYIDNLVRHARLGLVISWASPGQRGYSHVNTRPFDYVNKVIGGLGFTYDSNSTEALRGASKVDWLQRNIIVFRRIKVDEAVLSMHS